MEGEAAVSTAGRSLAAVDRDEALSLLGSVDMGRIVFTRDALPAIRPVNHAVLGGHLVIRTHEGAALARAVGPDGAVVAYEADSIDPATHQGWSVVVTGVARLVTDPVRARRYERLVAPWLTSPMKYAVLLSLDEVDGFRMV